MTLKKFDIDSFIYFDMIFTLHRNLIHKKIEEINNKKIQATVNQKLKIIF